jgi:hypothetical protein
MVDWIISLLDNVGSMTLSSGSEIQTERAYEDANSDRRFIHPRDHIDLHRS